MSSSPGPPPRSSRYRKRASEPDPDCASESAPRIGNRRRLLALLSILGLLLLLAGLLWRPVAMRLELRRAKQALEQHDESAAGQILTRVLERNPGNAEAHFLMARVHRRSGEPEAMNEQLEQALRDGGELDRVQRERWLAFAQAGHLNVAEPHLQSMLLNAADDAPDICEAYINGYMRNHRFEQAFQLIEAWRADYPEQAQPHVCAAKIWQQLKFPQRAAESLQQAVARSPERADLRVELANVLLELHEFDKAAEQLDQALADHPLHANARLAKARLLMQEGQEDEPRELLETLLSEQPDWYAAQLALGDLELSANRPEEALRWLRAAFEQNAQNPQLRYSLGSALQQAGQTEEAKEHFEFARSANQSFAYIQRQIELVSEKPEDIEPRFEIGRELLAAGRHEDGITWLNSVLQIDPDHAPTHAVLADYYEEQGQSTLAQQHRPLGESRD